MSFPQWKMITYFRAPRLLPKRTPCNECDGLCHENLLPRITGYSCRTRANGKPWPTLRLEQLEAIYRLKRVVLDGIKVDGMPGRYHSALVGEDGPGKYRRPLCRGDENTKPERLPDCRRA